MVALLALVAATLTFAPWTARRTDAADPPPVLNLVPNSGPCNEHTQAVARGAGFRPGQGVRLHAVRSAPVRSDNIVEVGRATAGADGILALPLPWIGCDPTDPPGTQYTVFVAGMDPAPSDVFTVGSLGERCFPETGFCVKERFFDYWRAHGLDLGDEGISERESLALFGLPLSREVVQTLEDGRAYTVQYFERARLEEHPAGEGTPYNVQLGQFGRQILAETGAAAGPTLSLDPDRGPCGTQTRVRGAGFPAGATIAVFVLYPSPRPPGGGGAQVAQLTADGAGAFAVTVPIVGCGPGDPEGAQFTISAGVAATDGPFARAVFTVERDAARP
jgi:hypothetical protein